MADIKLVIKINEEDFERCKKRFRMRLDIMGDAIANGIPLPKGHGRLIDADALNRKDVNCANVPMNFIDTASTIIEADK